MSNEEDFPDYEPEMKYTGQQDDIFAHNDTYEATYDISEENELRTYGDEKREKEVRVGAIRLNEQALESLTGGIAVSAKIAKLLENPVEIFEKNTIGFVKRYEKQFGKLGLSGILPGVLRVIPKLTDIKTRNSKAFVLGMCMLNAKNKVENSNNKLDNLYDEIGRDEHVKKVDILRYAFLCQKILGKKK